MVRAAPSRIKLGELAMETLILDVEQLVPGGRALARSPKGPVFLLGALPHEKVRARLQARKGYYEGEVLEILEAPPQRYSGPLPPSADLPLDYPAQLPIKAALVAEALRRQVHLEASLAPLVPSPQPLGYRTVAQYAVAQGALAYRMPKSHHLVPLHEDPLLAPPLARAFQLLQDLPPLQEVLMRGSLAQDQVLLGLVAPQPTSLSSFAKALVAHGIAGVSWVEPHPKGRLRGRTRLLAGQPRLRERFGPLETSLSLESFSQVNPLAARALYQEALELAGEGRRALELYAGSGVLGLHLAQRYQEVIAIEINPQAWRLAQEDRDRLGLTNFHPYRGDAETFRQFLPAELIVLDPPRSGLTPSLREALLQARPERILYIACDPVTWARDLAALLQGGYRLAWARPYDFYPFTHHVELLSLLVLG